MAGRRPAGDPLAAACGVSYKALVPLTGRAMLARVVATLRGSTSVGRIVVCGLAPAALTGAPGLAAALAEAEVTFAPADRTSGGSAALAIERLALAAPLLITTADHPLLRSETVDRFCAASAATAADVTFGLAPAELVRAEFPDARRTYYRFREGDYCGCNLYALLSAAGCAAPAAWARVEAHRKRPWRMLRMLGVRVLLRFLTRRLALADVTAQVRARLGLRVEPVVLSDATAGFDVDSLEHLRAAAAWLATHP